jgi:hypothetical protein
VLGVLLLAEGSARAAVHGRRGRLLRGSEEMDTRFRLLL